MEAIAQPSVNNPTVESQEDPAIELVELPTTTTPQPPPTRWHPKITPYRLCVIFTTIGLGVAKAVTAYRGETVAPVTIEWIAGVVVFIIFLTFANIESGYNPRPKWFFRYDVMNPLWTFMRLRALPYPRYQTDERDLNLLIKPKTPPITLYRLLVTICVPSFGLLKAALSYKGEDTAPTTVEWVFGVVVTLTLYSIGLYEASSTNVSPWLFEVDYSAQIALGVLSVGFLAAHILGLGLTSGWTYIWGQGVYQLWFAEQEPTPPAPDQDTTFVKVYEMMFKLVWTALAVPLGVGSGIVGSGLILGNLGRYAGPVVLTGGSWCIDLIVSLFSPKAEDDEGDSENGWLTCLESCISLAANVTENPPPALRILFVVVGGLLFAVGYVLGHALALLIAAGWTGGWVVGLYSIWGSIRESPWYMWGFLVVWSIGACFATVVGCIGCFLVIVAFFSPITGKHMWFS